MESDQATHHEVVIHVNEQPVQVPKRDSGLQIKEAAIAQGVPIQVDFVLSLELGDHRTKVIGNGDVIEVNEHSRFIAVASDDNSAA